MNAALLWCGCPINSLTCLHEEHTQIKIHGEFIVVYKVRMCHAGQKFHVTTFRRVPDSEI